MQIILNNPYRTVGLLVGATAREQERQVKRLKQFIEAEQNPQDDFSFPTLGRLHRTLDNITDAASRLNLDSDKMNAALFWFYKGNSITDEPAFDAIREGDLDQVLNIWTKLTSNGEVSQRNASAYSNLGTFYLSSILEGTKTNEVLLEQGISLKMKFLESDFIKDFKALATDETFKTTKKELQLSFLNQVRSEIEKNAIITSNQFLGILSKQKFSAKEDFFKEFVKKPIEQIEKKIEEIRKSQKANPAKAGDYGNELYKTTKPLLNSIVGVLGNSDVRIISISDKLANEILQCSINLFNHFHETDTEVGEIALDLNRKAESIALGSVVKERINESTPIVKRYINGKPERDKQKWIKLDLEAIINLLEDRKFKVNEKPEDEIESGLKRIGRNLVRSLQANLPYRPNTIHKAKKLIEDAFPHLINIKSALGGSNEIYLTLSTNIAGKAQNYIIETINNAQEPNTSFALTGYSDLRLKIEEAWDVTQCLGVLDMNFDFSMNYEKNKETLKNLCNQLGILTLQHNFEKIPQLNFLIIDSEITCTDKESKPLFLSSPLYDKYVRYVGLKLKIEALGEQTLDFFVKYLRPNGDLNNSKNSPKGYTLLVHKDVTLNTKDIDLLGWGNSDQCTYEVGTHCIEVWVNDCVICRKRFTVDLSPSQKIEKQLKEAEEKLLIINRTIYLSSEIDSVNQEMGEINKFKWLRSSSEKQIQISSQQEKINTVMKQSSDEKSKRISAQQSIIEKLKTELSEAKY